MCAQNLAMGSRLSSEPARVKDVWDVKWSSSSASATFKVQAPGAGQTFEERFEERFEVFMLLEDTAEAGDLPPTSTFPAPSGGFRGNDQFLRGRPRPRRGAGGDALLTPSTQTSAAGVGDLEGPRSLPLGGRAAEKSQATPNCVQLVHAGFPSSH